MGFFAEFNTWLNAILVSYIGNNLAQVAGALQPAIVTMAVLYVMVWGYLMLSGGIEEPLVTGVKRILTLALILGSALQLWMYHSVIVDTFFQAPGQLAAAVIGASNSVTVVDQIIFAGDDAASLLLQKGGILNGDFSYYLAGFAVYLIVGLTAIYAIFLLTLSRIALSILLVLGPLFIALLLFETTKKFFESWIAQMANYAFITLLTVLVATLMLTLLTTAAQQAVSAGGGITIAHAVRVCMAAGLTFLVMRQVMPMAAGLASGLALSTFGTVSAVVAWGLGRASRTSGQFSRGALLDRDTARTDSLARRSGYQLRRGLVGGAGRLAGGWRENSIRGKSR